MADKSPADEISDVIFGSLRKGGEGEEEGIFVEGAKEAICEHLDEKVKDEDYIRVCHRLLLIAYTLESERNSPTAGRIVAEVLERESNVTRMTRLARLARGAGEDPDVRTDESVADAKTRDFSNLTATQIERKAPQQDAPAPVGAIKLTSIVQPGVFNDRRRAAMSDRSHPNGSKRR
jgi:hypothetical protein